MNWNLSAWADYSRIILKVTYFDGFFQLIIFKTSLIKIKLFIFNWLIKKMASAIFFKSTNYFAASPQAGTTVCINGFNNLSEHAST